VTCTQKSAASTQGPCPTSGSPCVTGWATRDPRERHAVRQGSMRIRQVGAGVHNFKALHATSSGDVALSDYTKTSPWGERNPAGNVHWQTQTPHSNPPPHAHAHHPMPIKPRHTRTEGSGPHMWPRCTTTCLPEWDTCCPHHKQNPVDETTYPNKTGVCNNRAHKTWL
jgi:hypothetical protein